jgi:hypothetical protein
MLGSSLTTSIMRLGQPLKDITTMDILDTITDPQIITTIMAMMSIVAAVIITTIIILLLLMTLLVLRSILVILITPTVSINTSTLMNIKKVQLLHPRQAREISTASLMR